MLSKKVKSSKNNSPKYILNNLNNYIIKIDYFDTKGTKDFENKIPLKNIVCPKINLPKKNREPYYV